MHVDRQKHTCDAIIIFSRSHYHGFQHGNVFDKPENKAWPYVQLRQQRDSTKTTKFRLPNHEVRTHPTLAHTDETKKTTTTVV